MSIMGRMKKNRLWLIQITRINPNKTHNQKEKPPKSLIIEADRSPDRQPGLSKTRPQIWHFCRYRSIDSGHRCEKLNWPRFYHAKNNSTTPDHAMTTTKILDHAPTTAKISWPQGNHTLIQPDHSLTISKMSWSCHYILTRGLTTPVITRSLFNHAFVGGDTLRPRLDHNREIQSLFDFYPTIGRQGLTTPPVNRSRMDLPGTTAGLLKIS